jgi:hypothetical protein
MRSWYPVGKLGAEKVVRVSNIDTRQVVEVAAYGMVTGFRNDGSGLCLTSVAR